MNKKNGYEKRESFEFFTGFGSHIFFITRKRGREVLKCCGGNSKGQLGLNDYKPRNKPEKVKHFFAKIKGLKISIGEEHTLIATRSRNAFSCGSNSYGALSFTNEFLNTNNTQNVAVPCFFSDCLKAWKPGEKNKGLEIDMVFAGDECSYFLTRKGFVYSCGKGLSGNLGHGDRDNRPIGVRIEGIKNIVHVAPGGGANRLWCLFLSKSGRVYGCGENMYDTCLSSELQKRELRPVEITFFRKNELKISSIVTSFCTSFFLTDKGVYLTGCLRNGEIGEDDKCWGYGNEGYVGVPQKSTPLSDFDVFACGMPDQCMVYVKDGTLYGTGYNKEDDDETDVARYGVPGFRHYVPVEIPICGLGKKKICQINTSSTNTYVVTADSTVFACGNNVTGSLMNGTFESEEVFISLGKLDLLECTPRSWKEKKERLKFIVCSKRTTIQYSSYLFIL